MRTIGGGLLAALGIGPTERVQLLEFDFADNVGNPTPVYFTTAAVDVAALGHTFLATGHSIGVEPMGEKSNDPGQSLRVKLSGVDQTFLALLMGSQYRGRIATVWYAGIDPTSGQILTAPLQMFSGPMNGGFVCNEDRPIEGRGKIEIEGQLTSRLGELSKRRGCRCNPQSHNQMIPGGTFDTFFQNVDANQNRKVFWGLKTPEVPKVYVPTQGGGTPIPGGGTGVTTNPASNPGTMGGGTIGGTMPGATQSPVINQPVKNPGIGGVTPGATQSPNFGPAVQPPAPNIDGGSHGGGLSNPSGGSHFGGFTPGSR